MLVCGLVSYGRSDDFPPFYIFVNVYSSGVSLLSLVLIMRISIGCLGWFRRMGLYVNIPNAFGPYVCSVGYFYKIYCFWIVIGYEEDFV